MGQLLEFPRSERSKLIDLYMLKGAQAMNELLQLQAQAPLVSFQTDDDMEAWFGGMKHWGAKCEAYAEIINDLKGMSNA